MTTAQANPVRDELDVVQSRINFDEVIDATQTEASPLPSRFEMSAEANPLYHSDDIAAQMIDAVYRQLPIVRRSQTPPASERAKREQSAKDCTVSFELIRSRFACWLAWFVDVDEKANMHYVEDRSDIKTSDPNRLLTRPAVPADKPIAEQVEDSRRKSQQEKASVAAKEEAAKRFEGRFPDFGQIASRWFTHQRIASTPIDELYEQAPDAFRQIVTDVVTAFLRSVNAAQARGNYGQIDVGRDTLRYTFCTCRITDKLETELITSQLTAPGISKLRSEALGTRTTANVLHIHELLDAEFYDLESTLNNPSLELPPHFRTLLENAPSEIRPHLSSVFGTQIGELICAHDVDSKENVETTELARFLACEPCVLFAGSITLFGWGKTIMDETKQLYAEHRGVLRRQRQKLDAAGHARGCFTTAMTFGLGLLFVTALELYFLPSVVSILYLLPSILFSLACILYALIIPRRQWKRSRRAAKRVVDDGFAALVDKYPGFEPRSAHLVQPETSDE